MIYHIIGFREMCSTAEQTNSLFYAKRDLLTEMVLFFLTSKTIARNVMEGGFKSWILHTEPT